MGFGVSGQEVNSFSSKVLLSLPREVMLVEDAVDFSVGVGETEVLDYGIFMSILIHLGTNATLNHDMRYWNLPNIEPIENAFSI